MPGGVQVEGLVKLECAAGPGPIFVDLSSTAPDVANPSTPSVLVPVGQRIMPFTVTTAPVEKATRKKIVATANGVTKSNTLTVTR